MDRLHSLSPYEGHTLAVAAPFVAPAFATPFDANFVTFARSSRALRRRLCILPGSSSGAIAAIAAFRPNAYRAPMAEPSSRKLVGIVLIMALIVIWAAFVASLAQVVGRWPVLVQAPYYLFMGVAWVIPLKPLIRWIQTGSFRIRH